MLRIKLVKSPIGHTRRNRLTVAALGLRKVSQVVEHQDHPSIRGMIHKVKHLLAVEVVEGGKAAAKAEKPAKAAPAPAPEPVAEAAAAPKAAKPKAEKPADAKPKAVKPKAAGDKKK